MVARPLPDTTTTARAWSVVASATVAHLARYRGLCRSHTESDPRIFFRWCDEHGLDVLAVQRIDLELYVLVARRAPVQSLDRVAAVVRGRRVLPGLRHRPRAATVTGRACASPYAAGVTNTGVESRAVRDAARGAARLAESVDRANLDRHPNYILAAYMASGT